MCGIIGYTGETDALPILIDGLKILEYRGYDSAGVSLCERGKDIKTVKAKGRISDLENKLACGDRIEAYCGIGHTRWATHGVPSDTNSHPHTADSLSLVHNGIIENYSELKKELLENGYEFVSQTDTEVAAKYIDFIYKDSGKPEEAIFEAIKVFRGSYAFAIIFKENPDTLYAIRKGSPLIASCGENGSFLASDIPAILQHTRDFYRLDEGVLAVLTKKDIKFYSAPGVSTEQKSETVRWSAEEAKKGGFAHFMIKEIFDEPEAIRQTLTPRIENGLPHFDIELLDSDKILDISNIHIVACGTAMHAGLVGKAIIEKLASIPVFVDIASEFRYREPILRENDLVILLSQSGETADTLAALRYAKSKGVKTLAIVNVVDSSVAREADDVIYTWAGPEISVASTKAYTVQCALLYLLAFRFALANGKMSENEIKELCGKMLNELPNITKSALKMTDEVRQIAESFVNSDSFFFIGRGVDWHLSVEASLKLKEISYIHSEAYAAGELKHGTISLVVEGTPILAVLTVSSLAEKMISGIREVKSRGANVIALCTPEIAEKYDIPCDYRIATPQVDELFAPFPATTLLQFFAYFIASSKGLDVDKPRNLAKSVTVE